MPLESQCILVLPNSNSTKFSGIFFGIAENKRCLKWGGYGRGGRGGGFINESQLKLLKRGLVKAEVVRRREGVLKESPPGPAPLEILIVH